MTDLDDLGRRVRAVQGWPRSAASDGVAIRRVATQQRRRRAGALVGTAALLAGMAAATPVIIGNSLDGDEHPSVLDTSPGPDRLGVAAGYRAVGALGIVFEVPESWGTYQVGCSGWPLADTVAFGGTRSCLSPQPRVSSLIITTRGNQTVSDAVDAVPVVDQAVVPGSDVALGGPTLVDDLWTVVVMAPDGSVAVLRAVDEAVARHAADALRLIPDGWLPMPHLIAHDVSAAEEELLELGLKPEVTDEPIPSEVEPGTVFDAVDPGEVLNLDPAPSSLVPIGGEVALTRATPRR